MQTIILRHSGHLVFAYLASFSKSTQTEFILFAGGSRIAHPGCLRIYFASAGCRSCHHSQQLQGHHIIPLGISARILYYFHIRWRKGILINNMYLASRQKWENDIGCIYSFPTGFLDWMEIVVRSMWPWMPSHFSAAEYSVRMIYKSVIDTCFFCGGLPPLLRSISHPKRYRNIKLLFLRAP